MEFHVGRTPEIIELAECCLSVSGSVSLEMMYRLKPAEILYRVGMVHWFAGTYLLKTARYITLVNLLADREIYPEYPTCRDRSEELASHVLAWLNDPEKRSRCVEQLRTLRDEIGKPGACDRAATFLLETLKGTARSAA